MVSVPTLHTKIPVFHMESPTEIHARKELLFLLTIQKEYSSILNLSSNQKSSKPFSIETADFEILFCGKTCTTFYKNMTFSQLLRLALDLVISV